MSMMSIVFLVIYIICAGMDSWFCEKEKSRILKVLLMPLLCLVLLLTKQKSILLYLSLFSAWLGDIFLINKTGRNMKAGTICFLCTHIFYLVYFCRRIQQLHAAYILILLIYILYAYIYVKKENSPLRKRGLPAYMYMFSILGMSLTSCMAMLEHPDLSSLIQWSGTACFVLSDTLLTHQMFHHLKQRGVMPLYALAQLLIVTGDILA